MNPNQITDDVSSKLRQAAEHFENEIKKLRTGRASAAMLDGVMVQAYGTPMPLNQVANITAPEAQLLQITPFDPNNIQAIASAIRDNPTLGLNPSDDGHVVRVPIPALTEDRRRDIVKLLSEKVEECMITMRGTRHDALKTAEQAKRDRSMSEDEFNRFEKRIDELMSQQKQAVDIIAKGKEQEILSL